MIGKIKRKKCDISPRRAVKLNPRQFFSKPLVEPEVPCRPRDRAARSLRTHGARAAARVVVVADARDDETRMTSFLDRLKEFGGHVARELILSPTPPANRLRIERSAGAREVDAEPPRVPSRSSADPAANPYARGGPGGAGGAARTRDFLARATSASASRPRHHPYGSPPTTFGRATASRSRGGAASAFGARSPRAGIRSSPARDPLVTSVFGGGAARTYGVDAWRGGGTSAAAAAVGASHRYPTTALDAFASAEAAQRDADLAAAAVDADEPYAPHTISKPLLPRYVRDAEALIDLTFEESARKAAASRSRSRLGFRGRATGADASPAAQTAYYEQRSYSSYSASPAPFYAHGPRPIGGGGAFGAAEYDAEMTRDIEIAEEAARKATAREHAAIVARAGASALRVDAATPFAEKLARRSRFDARYHVASADAGKNDDGDLRSRTLGRGFGGALATSQLDRDFRAFDEAYVDLPSLEAYKARVAELHGEKPAKKPAVAAAGAAKKKKGRGRPKKKTPDDDDDDVDVDPITDQLFDDVDAQLAALRRGEVAALGANRGDGAKTTKTKKKNVATDRTALSRLRAAELSLEVRAKNASPSAPVDAAREADLERQIRSLLLEQSDLEKTREEVLSAAKKAAEEEKAGPDAAAVAAIERELLRPLTDEELGLVEEATDSGGFGGEVLASGTFPGQGALEMTRKDVGTMASGQWLNDEMCNFTVGTMARRDLERSGGTQPRTHFFNTFFIKKLRDGGNGYDYNAVRRWTTKKKLGYDALACDKVIVPVHQAIHWVLAVIDLKAKRVTFMDSLHGGDHGLGKDLIRWVKDETKNKREIDLDTSDWVVECPKDVPRQLNGHDCGVFMLKFADYIATGCPLTFDQRNMEYFRRRIIADAMACGRE